MKDLNTWKLYSDTEYHKNVSFYSTILAFSRKIQSVSKVHLELLCVYNSENSDGKKSSNEVKAYLMLKHILRLW